MKVVILVTNDLHQDQRMDRIAKTLVGVYGDNVTLVGRRLISSRPLGPLPYKIHRHDCRYISGVKFYAEIAKKHLIYLKEHKPDIVYAVDVDTLLPATIYKSFYNCKLIYDAHEWFTEVPELESAFIKKKIWSFVEGVGVRNADVRYTVSSGISLELQRKYRRSFEVVMNVPTKKEIYPSLKDKKIILYQGMLNKGRGLESMISAMGELANCQLWIVGKGDIEEELKNQAQDLENVHFLGWKDKAELHQITQKAWIGINLLDAQSLSYYYSLANKFFDYIQSCVPVITMNYPEYRSLNDKYHVGLLIDRLTPNAIVDAVKELQNETVYNQLVHNCHLAGEYLNWEVEEQKLINLLKRI